ncbi:MAG TPA: ABC transporter substrate-binding protein, partial [Pseudobdellovibrionaceae bacterium]|nr:ABC transporter substrate-binding protein [Pseudobdellovibrionaceae bacterium]
MKPLRGIVYLLSILCFLENAGATSTSNRHQGGEFRILSMGPEVRGFSLGKEFDEVLPWLCSKLFEPDYDSQELIPVIGDKWKLSQDLKTLKITIRPNAFFHDGTPITAEDVAYSFENLTKMGAHLTSEILLLTSEGGTKILDHLNLEIKFRQPFHDDLKTLFNTLYILPQPPVKKNSSKKKLFEEMNCSGPYQFESWPHGKKLTLKRFSKWFGFNDPNIKSLWSDFFHFSSVSFHFITDFHLIEPLMKKNEFDYFRVSPPIAKLVSDLLKIHSQFKKVTVKNSMPLDLHFIGVNFQNAFLKSLKMRKALASAFPFPLINQELFQDSLEPVYGPFTNNSPYFD